MAECCDGCINTNPANGCSVEEGNSTTASGFASHAEGSGTTASGARSHAEGRVTKAFGENSHAEGFQTTTGHVFDPTQGTNAHAEGQNTTASGVASHAEGGGSTASGTRSHAEGRFTKAFGENSHAEGFRTTTGDELDPTQGLNAHAEGEGNTATGRASHAEGGGVDLAGNPAPTFAIGDGAHAEGVGTVASGFASHAEGGTSDITSSLGPIADGNFCHAEGIATIASGNASHAEGGSTIADGFFCHAEGSSTIASGTNSHAEGAGTVADGFASHAEGFFTSTAGFTGSHIMGGFGDANESVSWFIANGISEEAKGLGAKWSGSTFDMSIDGDMYITGGADYAEMFETIDGKAIDAGFFVTAVEKGKIRKATASDHFILGVTSATPSLVGNSAALSWQGKYVRDEWRRKQYHEVTIPAKKDKKGNVLMPERKEMQVMLNPAWNPDEKYIPRIERPEWVAVGLIGQVLVRDDGTCEEQEYCWPNDDGIATKAEKGYFVLKRTGPNQILVLLNSVPSRNEIDPVVKLEKLAKLKEQGYLTEEEFQSEKQKLLNS
ncbi:peptidase G2 autoproteolytic cleavage domain-containing protein [Cytobacillus firmus]|uniref:peptidase G2 autoproteolytic cleavage domain-containing protein n=1 Tax=Cytobacillus firmus TaxID=1399 RepID=UPI001C8DCA02|nr:peptidase G2 autoproteolytic cleavage domain-containing protein [Cytobacillus firmus]MBX9972600.1 hypothetical protein [Cytobacillus firmus]